MSLQALMAQMLGKNQTKQQPEIVNTVNPAANGQQQQNSNNQQNNQTMVQQGVQQPAAVPKFEDLDDFAPMFSPPGANGQNNTPSKTEAALEKMFPDFASNEFKGQLEKLNFANLIPVTAYKSLLEGNPEEFNKSLNATLQQVMLYTMAGMGNLTEKGVMTQFDKFEKGLPDRFNQFRIRDTTSSHPILSNPAMAPIRELMASKFSEQYPQASQQQITEFTNKYLIAMANSINKGTAQPAQPNTGSKEAVTDWEDFSKDFG